MVSVKQHEEMEGFFEVPGYPYLYINKDGIAWDEYFKEYLRPKYGMHPYPELKPRGSTKPISIHRALGLTFIECPGDEKLYQIEHNDGNKTNFKLKNLKWVTRSENAVLAFKNGQRHDNRPVLFKDLRTGEIKRFYGVNECGRFLGIHPGYICTYLKRPQIIPFRLFYELIREGSDWIGFTEEDIGKHSLARPKEVVAVHQDSNKVYIFGSTSRASEFTKASHSQIADRASKKDTSVVNGFSFHYLPDYVGDLEKAVKFNAKYSDHLSKSRFVSTPKPIKVENTETGEVGHWKSTDEFASSLGLNKKTIQKSMSNNAGWYKRYLINYESLPSINSSN